MRGECGEMGREEMLKRRMGRMSGEVGELRAWRWFGGVGGRAEVSVLWRLRNFFSNYFHFF